MIMAVLAAPQAFFSCLTNGTSIQSAPGSVAHTMPPRQPIKISAFWNLQTMEPFSTHCDDDQNQSQNQNRNDDEIPVREISGREICLRLVGSLSEVRQFLVAHR